MLHKPHYVKQIKILAKYSTAPANRWPGIGSRSKAAPRSWSVFGCQHDGEDAGGLLWVAGVFAAALHVGSVIVDLPENLFALVGERAEMPLAVSVVVGREGVEGLHL